MTKMQKHLLHDIKQRISQKDPHAKVILFGSRARNQAGIDSDWDILILLNQVKVDRKTEKEYREIIFDIEVQSGEPISTFVFSEKEWNEKHYITPFYRNIQQDGIEL